MGRALFIRLALVTIFLGAVACGKSDPLTDLDTSIQSTAAVGAVSVDFCTTAAVDQLQVLKTIVILDHSGSNQRNFFLNADGSGSPALVNGQPVISTAYATDPLGLLRYGTTTSPGTLLNYLSQLPANNAARPTKYFALIDFSDSATILSSPGFMSDINAFSNLVAQDATQSGFAPADNGNTNYKNALTAANGLMAADVQAARSCAAQPITATPTPSCPTPGVRVASSYSVIFMSDGAPITKIDGVGRDSGGNVVTTGPIVLTVQPTVDILALVGQMTALTADQNFVTSVNLFTVYYYNPLNNIDQSARTLLAKMAKAGNGFQYDQQAGQPIDYSKFQPPRKRVRYTLNDIFVTNQSAVWWTDNVLHPDQDGDGLPDDVETAWGSSPASTDSDGNGVSDLVEFRLARGLTRPTVNYLAGACSAVPNSLVLGRVVFKKSDAGGLNDCEKIVLGNTLGLGLADSNADQIPDWLEFRAGLPFQVNIAPAINSRDQDGFTPYEKIKRSLPLNASANQLLTPRPADYALRLVSSDDSRDCYHLDVANLPILSASDVVRVDVLEKSEVLRDNGIYHVGTKAMGQSGVRFADWNDSGEILAGTWRSSP